MKLPGLPASAREVAILVTGAKTQCAYEIYSHAAANPFTKSENDMLSKGECPDTLDAKCKMAFKVTTGLFEPGPLSAAIWKESVDVLGKEGTFAVVHVIGIYKYTATCLNGFDSLVPDEDWYASH